MTPLETDAAARFGRLGETLDQIMTVDVAGRGAIGILHAAARRRAGSALSTTAALALAGTLDRGRILIICTGFPVRPWISPAIGETDGPPGAAALAWAVSVALGAIPVIATPPAMTGQAEAAARAFGLMTLPLDAARAAATGLRPTPSVVILPFTTDAAAAPAEAERWVTDLAPAAIAAIEHPGANAAGIYHASVGFDISAGVAKVEALFARAAAAGAASFTFADMPNEIGLGPLRAESAAASPYAERCQCPCQGGIAGASTVDHIVMATTANWGAYATAAALAVLTGVDRAATTPDQDARALAAVQQAGAVEGLSGSLDPLAGVDGIPTAVSGRVVALIGDALKPYAGLAARPAF